MLIINIFVMSSDCVVVELVTPNEARIYEQIHNIRPFAQQETTQEINTRNVGRLHDVTDSPTNVRECCIIS